MKTSRASFNSKPNSAARSIRANCWAVEAAPWKRSESARSLSIPSQLVSPPMAKQFAARPSTADYMEVGSTVRAFCRLRRPRLAVLGYRSSVLMSASWRTIMLDCRSR